MGKSLRRILYVGDSEGMSGYAQSVRRMIFCLQDLGFDISVKYVPHDRNICRDDHILNRVRSLYGGQGDVAIHHQIPHMFSPIHGCYNVGLTMFETTKVPQEWVHHCHKMDELWLPSHFNKTVFTKCGITIPIHVVPFPIDTTTFTPLLRSGQKVRFLSLFQWTERKNWRALLSAYFTEFQNRDPVELYLKVYAATDSEFEKQHIQRGIDDVLGEIRNSNRAPYTLDCSLKSENEIVRLMQESDVFVLPSRGEAIGLPYLEAMACGLPCIATAWGGQSEFINEANGYLADYTLAPVSNMAHIKEYKHNQEWADVDISSLRSLMRQAASRKDQREAKGAHARRTVEKAFSTQAIGRILTDRLRKIPGSVKSKHIQLSPVTYRGDALGISGYSNAIRLNLEIFRRTNTEIHLQQIHHDRRHIENGPLKDRINDLTRSVNRNQILIDHQTPEFYDTDTPYKYRIGITYFEASKIPDKWVERCNLMDEIWLTCQDNVDAFRSSGVKSKIELIDPYLDTDHFHPQKTPWRIQNKAAFNFVSVFEFHRRKGWDTLIEAYARAFDPSEDVCLILKTYRMHPPMSQDMIKTALREHLIEKGISKWPRVLIYSDPLSYQALPHLYRAADIFVLPTRGESICYPAMEAMSSGVPCIITNSGGPKSFITDQNGYPLCYLTKPVENFDHSPWYSSDQMITEPSIEDLMRIMRYAFLNRNEVKQKGYLARRDMETRFSITTGLSKIVQKMEDIEKAL